MLITVDAVILALLVIGAMNNQLEVLKLWATTSGLVGMVMASIVVLGFRLGASRDAYLVAARGQRIPITLTNIIVVGSILLLPHLLFTYFTWVQYSVVTEVFAAEPQTPVTSPNPDVSGQPDPTIVEQPVIWDGIDRLNILLMGADTGEGRSGIRTDTMMVASIDPSTGDTVVVSIPRNLSGIELPEGVGVWDCNCFPRLVNDLYDEAEANPDFFPGAGEPGPRAMKMAIGHLLDLEIQYYALVTLDGFTGIVDALGGVDIYVPNTIIDETYPHEDGVTIEKITIEEGQQHLDGHLALAYARIRRHADDYARMNRQRCILSAVVEQSNPLELLAGFGAIAEVLKESLYTDIPQNSLPDFIDLLPVLSSERIAVLHVDRDYISNTAEGRTYYDQDRIRRETHELIADPTAAQEPGALSFDSTCT